MEQTDRTEQTDRHDSDRGPCPTSDCDGRLTAGLNYVEPNRGYLIEYRCARCGHKEHPQCRINSTPKDIGPSDR